MSRNSTHISVGKKRLVVLGGGLGGLPLVRQVEANKKLSANLEITLIDKKEYFEVNLASVRFLVDTKHHNTHAAPYVNYLKPSTRFVCGDIRTVHDQPQQVEVVTRGGNVEQIPYDYLVIALGTRYPFFKAEAATLEERADEVNAFAQQIRNANHVLVVGGRSVGVEIVGEILETYPNKEVTIVHPGSNLMDMWPKSGIAKLNKYLAKKKRVNVVLKKKVARSEGNRHELDDGTVIEADVKILATGVTPNSACLQQHFAGALTPAGYVRVRKTLQMDDHDNVFVIGDLAEVEGPKMAANIKNHVVTTLKNLQASLNGKAPSPMGPPTMPYPALVTLGPSHAIMSLPMFGGSSFQGKFLSNLKTDLFAKVAKAP